MSETWIPTPKQAAVLEAAREVGFNRTVSGVCKQVGIAPSTFYRWCEGEPAFLAAWEGLWRPLLAKHMPGVVTAMLRKALDGDVPAARLLGELGGYLIRRQELTGRDGAPLVFTIDPGRRLADDE